jgi:hypothetical protein
MVVRSLELKVYPWRMAGSEVPAPDSDLGSSIDGSKALEEYTEEGESERSDDQEMRMVNDRESRERQRALAEELTEEEDGADSRSDWHSSAIMTLHTDPEAQRSNREAENSDDNLNSHGCVDAICVSPQNHVLVESLPDGRPDYMTKFLMKRSCWKGSNQKYLALVLIAIVAVTIRIVVPLLKIDNSPEAMRYQ